MEKKQYIYFVSFVTDQCGVVGFDNAMISFEEKLDIINAIQACQAQIQYQVNATIPHTKETPIKVTILIPPVFLLENVYDPNKKTRPIKNKPAENIEGARNAESPEEQKAPDNIVQINPEGK